jgi:hypothetical protein
MRIPAWAEDWVEDLRDWCATRSPWPRAPLAAYLLYAGVRHIADRDYRSWFAGLTLVLHEIGHVLFSQLGRTLEILGGTIVQLAVPLGVALYLLLRQRDWFGLGVGGSWLAFSTWEWGTYLYDANKDELALVGFSDAPQHDWGTLLTEWRVLNHTDTIAAAIRLLATVTWLAAMILVCVTLGLMLRSWTRSRGLGGQTG